LRWWLPRDEEAGVTGNSTRELDGRCAEAASKRFAHFFEKILGLTRFALGVFSQSGRTVFIADQPSAQRSDRKGQIITT
jgi:hypothetical protein